MKRALILLSVALIALLSNPAHADTTAVNGAATDLPGIKIVSAGAFVRHAGACDPQPGGNCLLVYGPFSFATIFGVWPGTHFANDEIFTLSPGQAISIPFTPSPGHSVSFFVNTTYTNSQQNIFSISTAPGLFNKASGGIVCTQGHNPNLTVSSNGRAGVGCVLNPGQQYWLNMAPGVVFNGNFTACAKSPCKVAVQEQLQN